MKHCAFPFLVHIGICVVEYLYFWLFVFVFVSIGICICELKWVESSRRRGEVWYYNLNKVLCFSIFNICICTREYLYLYFYICEYWYLYLRNKWVESSSRGERCWEVWNNNLNEALCSFSNVSLAHRTWQSRENRIRTLFQTLFDDWSFCAFLMSRLAPSLQSWEKSNWEKVDLGLSIGPFFNCFFL